MRRVDVVPREHSGLVTGVPPAPGPERLGWTALAACRGARQADFFPPAEDGAEAARTVCLGCPVRPECLAHALRHRESGIWGGTDERERTRMRRATTRRAISLRS